MAIGQSLFFSFVDSRHNVLTVEHTAAALDYNVVSAQILGEVRARDHIYFEPFTDACPQQTRNFHSADVFADRRMGAGFGDHYGPPDLKFKFVQGHDFPDDLSGISLVIHCGACMFNRREVLSRILQCTRQQVPFTNYGVAIAWCFGILERALAPFPEALEACRRNGRQS